MRSNCTSLRPAWPRSARSKMERPVDLGSLPHAAHHVRSSSDLVAILDLESPVYRLRGRSGRNWLSKPELALRPLGVVASRGEATKPALQAGWCGGVSATTFLNARCQSAASCSD